MTTATDVPPTTLAPDSGGLDLVALETAVRTSTTFACMIIPGLPLAGIIAACPLNMPPFAALMSGCFLFATGLTCHRAVAAFAGKSLRLLVAARLVIVLVLASLLVVSTGSAWAGLVSGLLTWLVADRLLGRAALRDLWRMTRKG